MTSPAADDTLTSYDTLWDSEKINIEESDIALSNNIFDWEGINVKDTNFESSQSSHILLNSAEPSSLLLDSEAASSNTFLNSKETSHEESNIALSDTFLNLDESLMTWSEPVFDSSDELNTFWTDESFSTDASLQASCVIPTDDFRLEARDEKSCSADQPEFLLPPSLQRLYEDPLGLVEDSLGPEEDDGPLIPGIYAEGDTPPQMPPREVFIKLLSEDPCAFRYPYRINLCCDGPTAPSDDVSIRAFYGVVYNCDPGTLFIPRSS
jgi:hypothetical protein